jgi:3-deoxy-7-phosphoheptulonate synthase / chorismate mutase
VSRKQRLVRDLAAQRRLVDGLNLKILGLIQERARVVLAIADLKSELGLVAFDPRREEQMLRAIVRHPDGPFAPAELREIFAALFRASLALQQRCRPRLDRAVGEQR